MELTATDYEGVCAKVVYTRRQNELLGILGDVGPVELPERIDPELQESKEVIVNCVQRHKCRPEEYCKKKICARAGVPDAFKCRFGYPFPECGQTRLEFNELDNGGVKANLVTRRNDGSMNSHNRFLLQNWRANVNIQLLLDWEDVVRYLVKYVSKQEKRSQPILDLFKSTVCRDDYDETVGTKTRLRKVFLKAVGERDITAQETSRLLLGGKILFEHIQL